MRLVPALWLLATAFVVLDFVSSITSAPGCGWIANLLWFIPDLRPLTSWWINYVIGVFGVAFVYGILALLVLAVLSRLTGGLFSGHIAAAMLSAVLSKVIVAVVLGAILHHTVQSLVARLC